MIRRPASRARPAWGWTTAAVASTTETAAPVASHSAESGPGSRDGEEAPADGERGGGGSEGGGRNGFANRGFGRFEIAIWNPERAWFRDEELTAVGDALGQPVQ